MENGQVRTRKISDQLLFDPKHWAAIIEAKQREDNPPIDKTEEEALGEYITEKVNKLRELTMINFIPANKRILMLPVSIKEQKTDNGIILPDQLNDKGFVGMIISIAADHRLNENPFGITYRPGDFVLYSVDRMNELVIIGQKFYMMNDFDIHGKIPNDEEFISKVLSFGDPQAAIRKFWDAAKNQKPVTEKDLGFK